VLLPPHFVVVALDMKEQFCMLCFTSSLFTTQSKLDNTLTISRTGDKGEQRLKEVY